MKERQGQQQSPVKGIQFGQQTINSLIKGGEFDKTYRDVERDYGTAIQARSPLFVPRAKLAAPRFVWDETLTDENKFLVEEKLREESDFLNQKKLPTLCENDEDEELWMAPKEYNEHSLRVGLIGKKIGVTNYWDQKTGFRKTCTLIQVPDNHVLRYFPKDEFNGLTAACIVGAGDGMGLMKNEVYNQYCRDAGVPVKSKCFRFVCTEDAALLPGTRIHLGHYRPGDFVDFRVKTVGYGHLDAMQRWHAGGGPELDRGGFKRGIGAISSEGMAGVIRGKKMAGKVGNTFENARGRRILRINYKHQVIWVNGRIPGHINQWVQIRDHMFMRKWRQPWQRKVGTEKRELPPFPTCFKDHHDSDNFPGEAYDTEYSKWTDESIKFK